MTFLALLQFHGPKSAYLGRVHAALLDFNELLSHTPVNLLLASLLHLPWVLGYLTLVLLIIFLVTVLFLRMAIYRLLPLPMGLKENPKALAPHTVESVLLLPNCSFNLLSVHHLTQTHYLVVTFTKSSIILQERISGQTIGVGCESHGLYYLSGSPQVCFSIISPLTIHAQLGHPGLPTLQKMVPNLHQLSSLHCDSCQFGIHTRSSFPSRVNKRAASSFALVDLDVWGPSRVITPTGFKYFVTFIDGFSRYT